MAKSTISVLSLAKLLREKKKQRLQRKRGNWIGIGKADCFAPEWYNPGSECGGRGKYLSGTFVCIVVIK